jgi:hypothetical protein
VLYLLLSTTVTTDPNPDKVSPGFAGFSVVFLLAVATIVLIRSMTRHLRNVRYSPEPVYPDPDQELDGGSFQGHRQSPGDVVDNQGVDPRRE